MDTTISVDPFRCRVWQLHDRLEEQITEDSCREEIKSFAAHGQLVPVLGRRVHGESDCDIELIYGARRLFVARHLKTELLVKVAELSDREAIIAMDIENRQRKEVSPYERGMSYARWLRGGYFKSQDDIAQALNVSASQVSRLLKLARLPSVVTNAFETASDIREGWGVDLAELLDDPLKRQFVIQAARAIAATSPRPPARDIYRKLLASGVYGRKPKEMAHDKVVKGRDGAPLFRIRYQQSAIAVLLPLERTSAKCLQRVESAVLQIMQNSQARHAAVLGESQDLQLANL